MGFPQLLATILLATLLATAASAARTIWEFPNGTWIENLHFRPNGQLLASALSAGHLYQVDPTGQTPAILLHDFAPKTGVAGIAELERDVFAVASGKLDIDRFSTTPHSYSVFRVDMRPFRATAAGAVLCPPAVSKITDMPAAILLNGLTVLDKAAGTILLADSQKGVVWRLDTRSGEHAVVLNDPLLKPTGPYPLGVNGVHFRAGMLHFTNTFQYLFGRVPVHRDNGTAAGDFEVVAKGFTGDDFTLRHGVAYIAAGSSILRISPRGAVTNLTGGPDTLLAGATAMRFGKSAATRDTLYVTTHGGSAGRVVAVNLDNL